MVRWLPLGISTPSLSCLWVDSLCNTNPEYVELTVVKLIFIQNLLHMQNQSASRFQQWTLVLML